MNTLLGITLILTVVLGPIYLGVASSDEDALFFIRKAKFTNKLIRHNYPNTWTFIESLIDTTKKDWDLDGGVMVYEPFPKTKIIFEDDVWMSLEIFEGVGKKNVFTMSYYRDSQSIGRGYDFMTNQFLQKEESFIMKQVMFHLEGVLKDLKKDKKRIAKKKTQNESEAFLKKKQAKKTQLLSMIEHDFTSTGKAKEESFSLHLSIKKDRQLLTISFENTVYFQALQLREHHKIKTTIHNQQNKEAQIFIELEKELIRFAKTTFQKKTCQKIEQGECV